ncbi:MAG: hypothetical protein HYY23_04380 [Verrucomicrobia bacterium]|nr:hypothetical protein [Verrucomicrobiota bacterium]
MNPIPILSVIHTIKMLRLSAISLQRQMRPLLIHAVNSSLDSHLMSNVRGEDIHISAISGKPNPAGRKPTTFVIIMKNQNRFFVCRGERPNASGQQDHANAN